MATIEISEGMKLTVLDNGARVFTDRFPHLESVSMAAAFSVGSNVETSENNGIAHFLEHVLFKDSMNDSGQKRQQRITDAGGFINATTSKDLTAYRVAILREDDMTAVDALARMICEPAFKPEQIETERGVILQEGFCECQNCALRQTFYEAAFPGQTLSLLTAGCEKNAKSFMRDDLMAFHRDYYVGENLIFAASGDIEHERYVEAIGCGFGGLPRKAAASAPIFRYKGGENAFGARGDQCTVQFGLPMSPINSDEYLAEYIFAQICGSGATSRLFVDLRETRGLVYDVSADISYTGGAPLAIVEATGAQDEAKNIFTRMVEILRESAFGLEESEARRAIVSEIANDRMQRDSAQSRVDDAVYSLLYANEIESPRLEREKLLALDVAQLRAAGQRLLARAPTLAAMGSVRHLPNLSMIGPLRKAA